MLVQKSVQASKITYKTTRKIFLNSLFFAILNSFNLILDSLIIGHLGTSAIVAIAAIRALSPILLSIFSGFRIMFIGKIITAYKEKKFNQIREIFSYIYFFKAIILMIAFLLLVFLQQLIINFRIQNDLVAITLTQNIYWLEIAAMVFSGFSTIFNWLFYVKNKNTLLTMIIVFGIFLNLTVSCVLVLAYQIGVLGASIGTFVSITVTLILKLIWILKDRDRILYLPIRIFNKGTNYKQLFSKWYGFPYEISYFFLEYIFFFMISKYFSNHLGAYSLISPFIYMVYGSVGMAQIFIKYSSLWDLSREERKTILKLSWRRINTFALLTIAVLVPTFLFSDIYKIDMSTRIKATVTIVFVILALSIFSPFYNISFNYALFKNRSLSFFFADLMSKIIMISLLALSGTYTDSIYLFVFIMVIFQVSNASLPFLLFNPLELRFRKFFKKICPFSKT